MCSRYLNKPTGLKVKPKIAKPNTTERKHSAFSQSWTGPSTKTKSFPNKRNSNFKPEPATHGHARRSVQQQTFRGPNPSLPHLKYGLFKKGKNPNADSSDKARRVPHEKKIKGPIEHPQPFLEKKHSDLSNIKENHVNQSSGEASEPVFVMRPVERNRHRLSRAASTHLDIKPRAIK